MARTRALYVLALDGAYVFYCNYYGFFAVLVLRCALAAPAVSLALGILGALCTRLYLEAPAELAIHGEGRVRVYCAGRFLPARFGGRLEACALLTGEKKRTRVLARGEWACPVDTAHCGCVRYGLVRAWATDPLGLFRLPLRRPQAAAVTVWPKPEAPQPVPPMPDALAAGVSHLVLTFADGTIQAVPLQVEDDLTDFLRRLLAQPVPQGAPPHALPPQFRARWQYTVHGKEAPHG